MSQINVNKVISPNQALVDGPSLDIAANTNISVDTDTLFVDSTNNRFGVGTSTPIRSLDISGGNGASFLGGVILENALIESTALSGTSNHNISSGSVHVWNTVSSNWTYNIRYSSSQTLNSQMTVGQTVYAFAILPISSSGYYNTAVQIDGVGQTPDWVDNANPTQAGGALAETAATTGYDIYSYKIIKTGDAAWNVFAGQVHFGDFT